MAATRRSLLVPIATLGALALPATPAPAGAQSAGETSISFSSASTEIDEGASSVRITVHRTGTLHVNRVLVDFATHDDTALAATDFAQASGTLTFEVGEGVKTIVVRLRDDAVAEPPERFEVRLSNPRGDAASVGAPTSVWIWDDDAEAGTAAPPPAVAAPAAARGAATVPAPPSPSPPAPAAAPASSSRAPAEARPAGRTRTRRAGAAARREVSYRSSPVTPFDIRPATGGEPATVPPPDVDPLLAALAGLILARVGAEVWFRARTEEA